MTIALESMAVEMPEVEGHPNRAAFRGVLTMVDVASSRAPSGSEGRRVVLTRKAAEAALPSLLGMALDYAPSFDRHDVRRKVGVITRAEVVGRYLEIGGYLYAKDFPDIVEEIGKFGRRPVAAALRTSDVRPGASMLGISRGRRTEGTRLRASLSAAVEQIRTLIGSARDERSSGEQHAALQAEAKGGTGLGMSFEVTNVDLVDRRARIWILEKVTFTGAAILWKEKAAFQETWIELSS
ncbi:MAG TPA: hypothetical protein VE377_13175 [Candidatus Dormibacteraeota bacterium]|nr:hypothetical protein [Candidatus Dormibacteraeota bacterium]